MFIAIKTTFFLCSRSSIIANRANEGFLDPSNTWLRKWDIWRSVNSSTSKIPTSFCQIVSSTTRVTSNKSLKLILNHRRTDKILAFITHWASEDNSLCTWETHVCVGSWNTIRSVFFHKGGGGGGGGRRGNIYQFVHISSKKMVYLLYLILLWVLPTPGGPSNTMVGIFL